MNKYEAMVIIKPDLSDEDKKTLFKQMKLLRWGIAVLPRQ